MSSVKNQFYITLPSNSSMDYYPSNKATNYITHLPSRVQLRGNDNWEVALVEAHYPCTLKNNGKGVMLQLYVETSGLHQGTQQVASHPTLILNVTLEPRDYNGVYDLLTNINTNRLMKHYSVSFVVDPKTGLVKLKCDNNSDRSKREAEAMDKGPAPAPSPNLNPLPLRTKVHEGLVFELLDELPAQPKPAQVPVQPKQLDELPARPKPAQEPVQPKPEPVPVCKKVKLGKSLALQLGFDPQSLLLQHNDVALRVPDISRGLPTQMYVYCDLAEPQLVGDTVAPLLRIVNIDMTNYTYGTYRTVHFHDPHYVPLTRTTFDTVEVDLRDDMGLFLPFHFGTTCMKLHLRRAQQ